MKTKIMTIAALIFLTFTFSSCSNKIVGVWNVENFTTLTQGNEEISAKNIGTITFRKNGNGTKELSYPLLGARKEDKVPFTWVMHEGLLTIKGEGSDFSKTWIITETSSKYFQLKSTDGSDKVQVLEIRK